MLIYIIYFIFIAALALEYEFKPFNNTLLLGFLILMLGLLAGLRSPEVGNDYESYQINFEYAYHIDDPLLLTQFEPAFIAIVFVVRSFFDNNYDIVIMLVFALASVTLKLISINRLAINPYLVILFYFSHYFILHEMTQIRIGFASGIFFLSLPYLLKGKRGVFIAMVLLATTFHYSAIFYLLMLLFSPRSFNYYIFSGLLLLSVVFAYVRLPLAGLFSQFDTSGISTKLEMYVELGEKGYLDEIRVYNILNIANLFCCVYLMYFIPKSILSSDRRLIIFLKCNIFAIFIFSFLSGVPSIAFRFYELFNVLSVFLFAYLLKYLPLSKFNILVMILLAALFLYLNTNDGRLLNAYKLAEFK